MLAALLNSVKWDERGAVAPTVGLSLFGLVAAGGLAFDYARMASLDTELQQAADQAALAAATQLDGKSGTCSRAGAAARALITNQTRFGNDSGGLNVTIATETACDAIGSIQFFQDKAKTTAATSDANAKFVQVTVNTRTANYALTPVIALLASPSLSGTAFAGLGSAVCKVPPVMICNPQETGGNTNVDLGVLIGKGLKLVSVGNGGGSWAPGNFGYLNTGGGSNGAPGLREALGWTSPPGDCVSQTGVNTKPGASVSVTDALNTRFDIYDSNSACPSGGSCPSSINAVKDLVRPGNANGNNACAIQNQGWQEVASNRQYLPTSATADYQPTPDVAAMGYPRDKCHAVLSGVSGACSGPIGDANWDRNAYFRVNYGWNSTQWPTNTNTGVNPLPSTPTRYQVYTWEINHRGETIGGVVIGSARVATGNGANALTSYPSPVCSSAQGYGSGITPGASSVDRRRISVAVVNCTANSVNGSSTNVPVAKWMEAFLVEPSVNRARTGQGDIYVEVIGETSTGAAGATSGQVVRRDVPYLIE